MCVCIYIYKCTVAPHNLTITADFDGDVMARPAVVEYGDILTLHCTTSGGHDNMFQWYKDDIILEENTDNILIITNVTANDGGLYECVVNNTAGNSSANITIYGMSYLKYQSFYHVWCMTIKH